MAVAPAFGGERERLASHWELCATPPGRCRDLAELAAHPDLHWRSVDATTVAAALGPDAPPRIDAHDWWYRLRFKLAAADLRPPLRLHFDGLAGVARVWLNGTDLLTASNMFVANEADASGAARAGANELLIRFGSLDAALADRHPRPRWRAPMIEHQQLRWFRTSLLGRMPGWTPPTSPVGLYKPVWLERAGSMGIRLVQARTELRDDGVGQLALTCDVALPAQRVAVELRRAGRVYSAALTTDDPVQPQRFEGRLEVPLVEPWWPHTHGDPALYEATLLVESERTTERVALHPIGFRQLVLDTEHGCFALRLNGQHVFCRGANWMPLDAARLQADAPALEQAVRQARDAGMNMLRISGATVYEGDAFFDACDRLGVLVWQDFMFANMDYPGDDPAFLASVREEARQQLERWRLRPSMAVICGNSEGEQQAAMWGAARDSWSPPLFHRELRAMVESLLPGTPYWPSSSHGGAFPHQANAGTVSYYGVGAYLRPLADASLAGVTFATECLGFSNVPEDCTIARMPGGHSLRVHQPAWKQRAPRDLGAGWDFEDVRDHYLALLFGVDPMRCRYADHDRYLALSRVVTGEVMAEAFAQWRRPGSRCGGALVWTLRDLWPGAGWGVIDDHGRPKACYDALRRVLQPITVLVTDEGVNGLLAHALNETPGEFEADLVVTLYNDADGLAARGERRLRMPARSAQTIVLAELFDSFVDLSYSYRFGPAPASLVHVALRSAAGDTLAEWHHFPAGRPASVRRDLGLSASLERVDTSALNVQVQSHGLAFAVKIEADGYTLSDNHFHMAPGAQRCIAARAMGPGRAGDLTVTVSALNASQRIVLRVPP